MRRRAGRSAAPDLAAERSLELEDDARAVEQPATQPPPIDEHVEPAPPTAPVEQAPAPVPPSEPIQAPPSPPPPAPSPQAGPPVTESATPVLGSEPVEPGGEEPQPASLPRPSAPIERSGLARPPRRGRSPLARAAAVVALAAVIAAVVLLVRALLHTGHAKVVTPPAVVKVLIPEGKTRNQIAQIAAAAGLKGSYRNASRRSPLLDPSRYGAPHGTPDLEGFLFPATYDANPGESVGRLVAKQILAFQENFGVSEIARAQALHVTPYQLLIVASMIEREAQIPGDRARIAAVIYNRLKRGIPLGIDATIYYAVEQRAGIATYTHELSEAQLQINSPYNTRTHTGLPPTPISNPGVASIRAAANPARVPYLYYVAGADGCGEQQFSTTLAAFEANAAAYRAAVAKNGGHPPRCKKH
jgi:cell division protein YceG involved in septum cleavage